MRSKGQERPESLDLQGIGATGDDWESIITYRKMV